MASTRDDLFAAIEAEDAARVVAIVASDPSLASARDGEGVSALMRARYRSDRDVIAALRDRVDALDVFEAAAFGEDARLDALLSADPPRRVRAAPTASPRCTSPRSSDGLPPR
jgi:hypothetical protein